MRRARPFVILKMAISADHAITARQGVRSDLTGPIANRHAQRLRAEVDAIVARYRLLLAGCRIAVDVMTPPVAHQSTARPFKLASELSALHKAISFIA